MPIRAHITHPITHTHTTAILMGTTMCDRTIMFITSVITGITGIGKSMSCQQIGLLVG